jgi:hypothetical protein
MQKPKVLIEVKGGVAEYRTKGKVDVCLVDYDAREGGETPEVPEEFYKAFEGLRESLQNDEYDNNQCTSWHES